MSDLAITLVAVAMALSAANGVAQDKPQAQQQAKQPAQSREQIYGSQLMTPQERTEYRDRMRAAKTQQERDQLRAEHHARMQGRAKERGVMLPDAPPAKGAGKGGAGGYGAGKGPGPRGPGAGKGYDTAPGKGGAGAETPSKGG